MQGIWDWINAYGARWHDIWEILGAVATAAAVIVALQGVRHERRAAQAAEVRASAAEAARDAERARADRERAESEHQAQWHRRRRQAELVVVEPYWGISHVQGYWGVRASNFSSGPVFDIKCTLELDDLRAHDDSARVLAPNDPLTLGGFDQVFAMFTPRPEAWIQFRDMAGVIWRRNDSGALEEIGTVNQPEPPPLPLGSPPP